MKRKRQTYVVAWTFTNGQKQVFPNLTFRLANRLLKLAVKEGDALGIQYYFAGTSEIWEADSRLNKE